MKYPYYEITCTCSEQQLSLVGCDCGDSDTEIQDVSVWLDGYPGNRGPAHFSCSTRATPNQIRDFVRKQYGRQAAVFHQAVRKPHPAQGITAEQARYYTKGDNS